MRLIIEKVKNGTKPTEDNYLVIHDMEDGNSAQSMVFQDLESAEKYIANFKEMHPDFTGNIPYIGDVNVK